MPLPNYLDNSQYTLEFTLKQLIEDENHPNHEQLTKLRECHLEPLLVVKKC